MFKRKREQLITISLQVENEWAFHIKAPAIIALEASTDWLNFVQRTDEGGQDVAPVRQPVGFSRGTPAVDLGETTADTQRAYGEDDD